MQVGLLIAVALAIVCQVQAGLPEGCKWVEVYGKRLVQHNDKNLNSQKLTVAQCKKKCEDFGGFKCRSFDAHADTKKCQLSKADRAVSYLWDYMDGTWTYQEIQCDNDVRSRKDCARIGPFSDQAIPDFEGVEVLTKSTAGDCEKACREHVNFFCQSFNFNPKKKECSLQMWDRSQKTLQKAEGTHYYELNCEETGLPEGCKWVAFPGYRLNEYNRLDLNSKKYTLAQCATRCAHATNFKCRGFDAHWKSKKCILQNGDRADSYLRTYMSDDIWVYKELQCDDDVRSRKDCPLRGPEKNKAIPDFDAAKTLTGKTVAQCETACREEEKFFCKSFNYQASSKKCTLQIWDKEQEPLASKSGTDYYELNCNDPGEPEKTCSVEGNTLEEGDFYTNNDCTKNCECLDGELKCQDLKCGENFVCKHEDGQNECVCPSPYVLDEDMCVEDDPCLAPKVEGSGTDSISRYYYSIDANDCFEFAYTGAGGNPNNYKSERECIRACGRMEPECYETPQPGNCDNKITRYYFNLDLNVCKKLFYTGCGGNGNNFATKTECAEYCKKPWDDED